MANVIYQKLGDIAVIKLSHPPVNALTQAMKQELIDIFDLINTDFGIKAAIFTAEGKGFCAGGDVTEFGDMSIEDTKTAHELDRRYLHSFFHCRVPIIAAIYRYAVGAGCTMAAACDIILATPDTKLGMPELRVGMVGGPEVLDRLMPKKIANYYALTGNYVTAQELMDHGGCGIFKLVEQDGLLDAALGIAREIAALNGTAVELTRQLIVARELGLPLDDAMDKARQSSLVMANDPGRRKMQDKPYWKKG